MTRNDMERMAEPVLNYYDLHRDVVAFSTTRQGGCSQGAYSQLNVCHYCGDDEQAVQWNREALGRVLGVDTDCIVMPRQTHQTVVAAIDDLLELPAGERQRRLEGVDAVMTGKSGVCIGVSTADCIPVLLYDTEHRAACAVHAGWRGTVQRIALKAVAAMSHTYGTRPAMLRAVVGPGISLESFEVGQEVYDAFAAAGFDMEGISERRGKWHLDLPGCNRQQLIEGGVPVGSISLSGVCTFQHPDVFFSARRLGIRSGRIFTAILMKA